MQTSPSFSSAQWLSCLCFPLGSSVLGCGELWDVQGVLGRRRDGWAGCTGSPRGDTQGGQLGGGLIWACGRRTKRGTTPQRGPME